MNGTTASINYENGRLIVSGDLDFSTVMNVWNQSIALMSVPTELQFDLSNVISSNSAGLALLVEWIKYAKKTQIKEDEIYVLFIGIIVIPEVVSIMGQAEKEFGREINYTVMTEEEFAFRKKNNDPFIWRFLKQPKVMLIGNEEELLK